MKNRIHILILLCLLSFTAKANPPFAPAPKVLVQRYGFSFAGSAVFSFFKVDTRESEKAHMRPGFSGEFRFEFYPTQNVHLQAGLELMTQSCRFNTYYFAPGYSQFYDLNYAYTHTLRTMELYLPLTCRIGFAQNESNSRAIFYMLGGYSPKIFLGSTTNIVEKETGKGIWGGSTELEYEHHFLGLQEGNCMIIGTGLDKRLGMKEKFVSYEIIFRYNLSRFNYKGRIGLENTNDLMIKNCCINVQVGYRFQ
ncbi:MAG TPA: hypothetical protein VFJ43_05975 [Bacteroidia bacterium]|nr:hypothetical protein [Bacteroidia bacterium]